MKQHLYTLPRVDSTNTWARKHLHTFDESTLTVIWAEEQTEGRGQRNNSWFSPPKENLYVTFVLPFSQNPFLLAQAACLAVQKTLSLFQVTARIKWPNDLMTSNGKISGILIEHAQEAISWGLIGVGINVQMKTVPAELNRPITSIYLETKTTIPVSQVLEQLTSTLQYYLNQPQELLQSAWLQQVEWMIGTDQMVRYHDKPTKATVTKISPQGHLTCRIDGKEQVIQNLV